MPDEVDLKIEVAADEDELEIELTCGHRRITAHSRVATQSSSAGHLADQAPDTIS